MRVSATWTTPTPSVSKSTPIDTHERSSRLVILRLRARSPRIAVRIKLAVRKRDPAVSSGGSVSTATLIAKYVDPQTT
jgi:hypothetical protein